MANRADIKAGGAYVELALKDSAFVKGLTAARKRLQSLGGGMMQIGAGLTAMGTSIVAPIAAAVTQFVSLGSELADVSARTGLAASSLAELKFAAEQSGSSLGDVEQALKFMAKSGKDVQQFDAVASAIAAIEDPSERAKAAIENFGKSGTKLLPMLENLQQLRQEAQGAGLVPSDEAVSVADALGDAFDKIRAQGLAALFEIGAAVGPALLPALQAFSALATKAIEWTRENQGLVRTVAAIGAGLVGIGVVVTTIGATLFGVGTALGAIVTAVVTVGSVLASPLGIVLALAAATAAWLKFTTSGQAAAKQLAAAFQPLLETFRATVGGIGDALMGGELLLAGQIAAKGLQVIFLQGIEAIAGWIGGTLGGVFGDLATRVIQGDLAGAWQTVVQGMAAVWDQLVAGIVEAFASAIAAIEGLWRRAIATMQVSLGVLRFGLQKLGLDGLASGLGGIQAGIRGAAAPVTSAFGGLTSAGAAVAGGVRGAASGSADQFGRRIGSGGPSEALERMTAELEALRKQAAEARAGSALSGRPDLAGPASLSELKQAAAVTFSGAGLLALGAGGGPQERMARGIERLTRHAEEQAAREERLIKAVERGGTFS